MSDARVVFPPRRPTRPILRLAFDRLKATCLPNSWRSVTVYSPNALHVDDVRPAVGPCDGLLGFPPCAIEQELCRLHVASRRLVGHLPQDGQGRLDALLVLLCQNLAGQLTPLVDGPWLRAPA